MSADDYVHRIGRTGRAGSKGRAWMFATHKDEKFMDAIQKLIKKEFKPVKVGGGQGISDKSENTQKSSKNTSKKKSHAEKYKHEEPHNTPDEDQGDSFGDDIPAFLR
jgi:superfamily II DNA/RNA helicase